MAFNKLNVVIGANIESLQKELAKVEKSLQRFGRKMQQIGTDLTQTLTIPIAGLGAASLKAFSDIERLEKGLIALMGSSEAAKAEMIKLREVAKLPGLGFEEAIKGSVSLQAVGFSADKARETLLAFGKAVAVSGGTREDFNEVIYQLAQMNSKGKILAEDFKVLQSRIPILGTLLQDAFGTRNIAAIRDSGVSTAEFTQKIIDAANKSKVLANVTGGLGNAFENFKDSAKIAFATLGQSLATAFDAQNLLDKLAKSIQGAADWFSRLSPATQKFIAFAGLAVATVGPLLLIIGKMVSVFQLATLGFSTLTEGGKRLVAFFTGIPETFAKARTAILAFSASLTATQAVLLGAGIGVALLALAAAYTAIQKSAEKAGATQKALADIQSQAIQQTAQEVGVVRRLVDVAKDENASKEDRIKALNELKRISPEYFGGLDAEKIKTTDLIAVSDKYAQSLINRAKAQLLATKIAEIDAQLIDSQKQGQEAQLSIFQQFRVALASVGGAGAVAAKAGQLFGNNLKENTQALQKQRAELEKNLKSLSEFSSAATSGGGIPTVRPSAGGSSARKSPAPVAEDIRGTLIGQIDLLPKYASLADITALSVKSLTDSSLNLKVSQDSLILGMQNSFPSIEEFKTQVESLGLAFDAIGEKAIPSVTGAVQEGLAAFGQYAKSGIKNMKDLGKAVLAAGAVIIKSLIQQGVAAAVSNALKNPAGIIPPLGLALATAAGLAASGLFSSLISKIGIPQLAGGGIAYGNSLVNVGEYPGARTNPEVIAPLDKLKKIIGGGGSGGFIAETVISGSDLRVILSRADRTYTRYTTG